MLRDDIREFVRFTGCKTLNEMAEKARERVMELDTRMKRKNEQTPIEGVQSNKPKTSNSPGRGQQGWGRCAKSGRLHSGACQTVGMSGYYSCGHQLHVSRDCPKNSLICFHCNQTGQKRTDFLSLHGGGGGVAAPCLPY